MNAIHKQIILLVDDSADDIELMRHAFQSAKSLDLVQVARDGEEAVAYLSGTGPYQDRAQFPLPAVMLLDLNMPRMDGFEVLAWLQAQPALKRLMVIMLSASRQPADVAQAYDLGAKAFLVKPGKFDDLIAMLRCLDQWLGYNRFAPIEVNPAESEEAS